MHLLTNITFRSSSLYSFDILQWVNDRNALSSCTPGKFSRPRFARQRGAVNWVPSQLLGTLERTRQVFWLITTMWCGDDECTQFHLNGATSTASKPLWRRRERTCSTGRIGRQRWRIVFVKPQPYGGCLESLHDYWWLWCQSSLIFTVAGAKILCHVDRNDNDTKLIFQWMKSIVVTSIWFGGFSKRCTGHCVKWNHTCVFFLFSLENQ